MRITFDVNILVRAVLQPTGPEGAVLGLSTPPHVIVLSEQILADVRKALHYPRIQKRSTLSSESIDQFVAALRSVADLVSLQSDIPKVVSDVDDDVVIATALAANADMIVSGDSHLLRLKAYRSILMATVSIALERVIQN